MYACGLVQVAFVASNENVPFKILTTYETFELSIHTRNTQGVSLQGVSSCEVKKHMQICVGQDSKMLFLANERTFWWAPHLLISMCFSGSQVYSSAWPEISRRVHTAFGRVQHIWITQNLQIIITDIQGYQKETH